MALVATATFSSRAAAGDPPQLQVAGPPLPLTVPAPEPPSAPPAPPVERGFSDGAGPRLTFGRTFTQTLNPGFYGRFETEYFEVRNNTIIGFLAGLEGWGTEGATAGGGAIPITLFAGARGGPFSGPKAPKLFFTLGLGVDFVVYDRIGGSGGFGLFSPFGVVTAGIEMVPGLRLLADSRAIYRWHWTSRSEGQVQLGLTVGLNSYLWDGP
ncbi:MAG: hypothetical protein ABJE95_12150 [Byssovorax sp.]